MVLYTFRLDSSHTSLICHPTATIPDSFYVSVSRCDSSTSLRLSINTESCAMSTSWNMTHTLSLGAPPGPLIAHLLVWCRRAHSVTLLIYRHDLLTTRYGLDDHMISIILGHSRAMARLDVALIKSSLNCSNTSIINYPLIISMRCLVALIIILLLLIGVLLLIWIKTVTSIIKTAIVAWREIYRSRVVHHLTTISIASMPIILWPLNLLLASRRHSITSVVWVK